MLYAKESYYNAFLYNHQIFGEFSLSSNGILYHMNILSLVYHFVANFILFLKIRGHDFNYGRRHGPAKCMIYHILALKGLQLRVFL